MGPSATHDPEITLTGDDLLAWRDYVRLHAERGHSAKTLRLASYPVCQLAAVLYAAGATLATATRAQCSDYLLGVGERNRPSTHHRYHAALRSFYAFLLDEEYVTVSPMAKVRAPEPDVRIPRVVPNDEYAALLKVCQGKALADLRDTAMLLLWSEPGSPRADEMARMRVADILPGDICHLEFCKGGKHRDIGMTPRTARAVSRYMRARARHPRAAETEALWLGPKGPITASACLQMVKRRSREAGIPETHPHALRHTAYAAFLHATGNVIYAKALFGWESDAMPAHYARDLQAQRAIAAAQGLNLSARIA